ncbi:adenylate kinase [Pseudothermotoga sp.]|nr:adenylate kinase [Pseudothermotoga sp.]MCX7812127.1 adenylate kinase [Pseudothermotoga sp.]MDW8139197.1 adenylate kinase [Pseudothermotoga sp.]
MRIVLLGAPGAGKGTLAKDLIKFFGVPHISTGDMFREAVSSGSELGKQVEQILKSGALVPDEIVNKLVKERISRQDCENGFIFDGYPRTLQQALALDEMLKSMNKKLDAVLHLKVSEDVVVKRLTSRRICLKCGKIYNLLSMPPKEDELCDDCKIKLNQRDDDREDVVRKRFRVYNELTAPLIDYYKQKGILLELDSDANHETVVEEALKALRKVRR